MKKCSLAHCYAPETGCKSGEPNYRQCEYWLNRDETLLSEDEVNAASEDEAFVLLPWSGNTMGVADLELVASRSRPYVVGIAGSQNAGKTTFLAMIYLLMRRGNFPDFERFAGSFSLGGWEQLATYFEWKSDTGPQYPPHTSANEGRQPGLLHLAFRNSKGTRHDTLWTDAPGEWFRKWAIRRDDIGASGARWTYEYADSLLLFADSAALAGDRRGAACTDLEMLADRLGEELKGRKVALVWAKSDIEVLPSVRDRVENACRRNIPTLDIFRVQVPNRETPSKTLVSEFVRLMTWVLSRSTQDGARIEIPASVTEDPLLAFRGPY